jgi:glutamate carboxypeptidase
MLQRCSGDPMKNLIAQFERQLPQACEFLETMVTMESPSFDKPLVDQFARLIGRRFTEIGGSVEYIPADRFGDHVSITFGNSESPVLLLGHTDTVWPAGEIAKRPFKIENGRATGPGAFDMKAGILLMWMVLQIVRENSVRILLTGDEEAGSVSSRSLIESVAGECSAVLVLEPSLPGGALKTARKGVGRFTIKAIGRAAHAGIDPQRGVNAIEEIARQILKVHQMTDASQGTTVSVGVVARRLSLQRRAGGSGD